MLDGKTALNYVRAATSRPRATATTAGSTVSRGSCPRCCAGACRSQVLLDPEQAQRLHQRVHQRHVRREHRHEVAGHARPVAAERRRGRGHVHDGPHRRAPTSGATRFLAPTTSRPSSARSSTTSRCRARSARNPCRRPPPNRRPRRRRCRSRPSTRTASPSQVSNASGRVGTGRDRRRLARRRTVSRSTTSATTRGTSGETVVRVLAAATRPRRRPSRRRFPGAVLASSHRTRDIVEVVLGSNFSGTVRRPAAIGTPLDMAARASRSATRTSKLCPPTWQSSTRATPSCD